MIVSPNPPVTISIQFHPETGATTWASSKPLPVFTLLGIFLSLATAALADGAKGAAVAGNPNGNPLQNPEN